MNTKHTPGPWHLGTNGDDCAKEHAICSSDGVSVIAKVYGLGYPIGKGWHPRSAADARLIAAAPEMCKTIANIIDERDRAALYDDDPAYQWMDRAIDAARALLARIDGATA